MGKADYLALGDHNGICEECGKKFKMSKLRQTWEGLWTCNKCWDPRHPQERVRAKADIQTPAETSGEPDDEFI